MIFERNSLLYFFIEHHETYGVHDMRITATFLDEISHDIPHQNWGREEWDADFRAMKAFGIRTVVMIRCGWKRWMTYPSAYLMKEKSGFEPPVDLLGMFLETFILKLLLLILTALVFVIIYARMIEIYLMTSLAPIPLATMGNREQSQIGQNYLRSLFALGLQGFLILICVGIYAVLIQNYAVSDHLISGVWALVGYTILLCFTLFKTGSLAKSILNAH